MEDIPSGVYLTSYDGGITEFMEIPLEDMVRQVAEGSMKIQIGKIFKMEQIVEAHELMEKNKGGGKGVVLVD